MTSRMLKAVFGSLVISLAACASHANTPASGEPAGAQGDRMVLLGTQGGPAPSPARAGIATLLVIDDTPYLIDAGEGVVRQMSHAGWQPAQVRNIFITHHHVDHQSDLPSLISLSWFATALRNQELPPVQIFGPPATQYILDAALDYLSVSERTFGQIGLLSPADTMFEATDIADDGVVFEDDNVRVTAIGNTHYRHPSTGPGGVLDRSLSYRFDTPSVSVVFTGDTGPSDELIELARGADILVSEISMQFIEPPLPEAAGMPVDPSQLERMRWHHTEQHLTPEAVGRLATEARVGKVVLSHLVPGQISSDISRYVTEVGMYFDGEIIVGEDLMSIPLAD